MTRFRSWQSELHSRPEDLPAAVRQIQEQNHELQRELAALHRQMAQQSTQAILDQVVQVDGVPVLAAQIDAPDAETMREMTDWLRDKLGSSVVVIGAVVDGRPQLVAAVTKDVAERGVHAGNMVRAIAKTIGGGGGGSPQMAQAGGKNGEMLPEALSQVQAWVAEQPQLAAATRAT